VQQEQDKLQQPWTTRNDSKLSRASLLSQSYCNLPSFLQPRYKSKTCCADNVIYKIEIVKKSPSTWTVYVCLFICLFVAQILPQILKKEGM
jgi:hypothetical protein